MKIQIHGLVTNIKKLTDSSISELLSIIDIDRSRFLSDRNNNLTFKIPGAQQRETVSLRLGTAKDGGNEAYFDYPRLTLHGSYFDYDETFRLGALLEFFGRHPASIKQLDVCYIDNEKIISVEQYLRWTAGTDWKDHCTGSLFRTGPAIPIQPGGVFSRIQFASASSQANYGTYYHRPDGERRLELKLKDPAKIEYLLAVYDDNDLAAFNKRALEVLTSCVDFVTPASKRSRDPAKYARHPLYKQFLGSAPAKINWTEIKEGAAQAKETADINGAIADLQRVVARLHNSVGRVKTVLGVERITDYILDAVITALATPA